MRNKILFVLFCILLVQLAVSETEITVTEGDLVRLSVIANDSDKDRLFFTFTEPVNNKGLWQTEYGDRGDYFINVTVCDKEFCDSDVVKLTVIQKLLHPNITYYYPEELNLSIKEGESVYFKAGVEDIDSEKLYLSWKLDRVEVSTSLNLEYTTDYYSAGKHTIRFTVSDGHLSDQVLWNINVEDLNGPPVLEKIEDIRVTEGGLVNISPKATDPDHDKIEYSISEPVGGDRVWQTGFDDAGEYEIEITASDGFLSDSQTVKIVVEDNDRAPAIVESYPEEDKLYLKEGSEVSFSIRAIDPDRDELFYSWTIDEDEVGKKKGVKYYIDYESAGVRVVKCAVSDGVVKTSKKWILVIENVNQPPVLDVDEEYVFNESDLVKIAPKATDPDGDKIIFLFSEPLDENGEWRTDHKSSGVYAANISVSDGEFIDSKFVKIVVKDVDTAPVFEELGEVYAEEGTNISIRLNAYDYDGEEVSFFAEELPEGAVIEDNMFKWVIGHRAVKRKTGWFGRLAKALKIYDFIFDDSKKFEINIIAEAGEMFSMQKLMVIVSDKNRVPVIDAPYKIKAKENELVKINHHYYDLDGDRLKTRISYPFNKDGEWHTDFDDSGEYNISISVDDNLNRTIKDVLVEIGNVNREPLLSVEGYVKVKAGEEVVLEPRVIDLDYDNIMISYSGWMDSDRYWTNKDDSGIHTVTVSASDSISVTSKDITVEVKPPVIFWFYFKFVALGLIILALIILYLGRREKKEAEPEEEDFYEIEEEEEPKKAEKITEIEIEEPEIVKTHKINSRHVIGVIVILLIIAASIASTIFLLRGSDKLVFKDIGNREIDEGKLLEIEFRTRNADSIDVSNLPYGSRFKDILFTWTPNFEQSGIYDIKAVAYNNESEKAQNFSITVNDVNRAPKILSTSPLTPLSIYAGKEITFSIEAEDEDKGRLSYTWYLGFEKYKGKEHMTRVFTVPGKKTVKVKVSDGKDTVSYTWKVKVVSYTPKIIPSKTYTITEIKTGNVSFPREDTSEGEMSTYIVYGGEEPDEILVLKDGSEEDDVNTYVISG